MPEFNVEESLTLQNIAMAALVALLSWNVYTTQELKTSVAVIGNQLAVAAEERFTLAQAALLEQRINQLEIFILP